MLISKHSVISECAAWPNLTFMEYVTPTWTLLWSTLRKCQTGENPLRKWFYPTVFFNCSSEFSLKAYEITDKTRLLFLNVPALALSLRHASFSLPCFPIFTTHRIMGPLPKSPVEQHSPWSPRTNPCWVSWHSSVFHACNGMQKPCQWELPRKQWTQ